MRNRVLVIGGSGFIGSHVADELTERGFDVVIFDSKESQWLRPTQFFVNGDINDSHALSKAMVGCRYVYNFASLADIDETTAKPVETIELNVLAATRALEAARQHKVERFVFSSTVYVNSHLGSFYRASKQAMENIIALYADKFGLAYTVLRYGSVYGPRAQKWNGLRKIVQKMLRDDLVSLRGNGKERREYVHVLDAARMSVDILDETYRNKTVMLTGQQALSAEGLVAIIQEITGLKRSVNFVGLEEGSDHYGMTPYRHMPDLGTRLVPQNHIDIGSGILELVQELYQEGND